MSKDYGKLEKNIPVGMEDSNSRGKSRIFKLFPEVGDCRWFEETENPIPKYKAGRVKSKAYKQLNSMRGQMSKYGLAPKIKTYYSADGSVSGYRMWRTK